MKFWRSPTPPVPATTYVELVRSLLGTMVPTVMMGVLMAVVAVTCEHHVDRPLLAAAGIAGSLLGLARFSLLLALQRIVAKRGLDEARARWLEPRFATVYLSFAL